MAVPKKRTSRARRDTRRSHHALQYAHTTPCANCGTLKLPHHICHSCGMYRGKQLVNIKAKTNKEQ